MVYLHPSGVPFFFSRACLYKSLRLIELSFFFWCNSLIVRCLQGNIRSTHPCVSCPFCPAGLSLVLVYWRLSCTGLQRPCLYEETLYFCIRVSLLYKHTHGKESSHCGLALCTSRLSRSPAAKTLLTQVSRAPVFLPLSVRRYRTATRIYPAVGSQAPSLGTCWPLFVGHPVESHDCRVYRPAGSARPGAGLKHQGNLSSSTGDRTKRLDELGARGKEEGQSRSGDGRRSSPSISEELQALVDADRKRRSIVDLLPLFLNRIRSVVLAREGIASPAGASVCLYLPHSLRLLRSPRSCVHRRSLEMFRQ